MTPFALSILGVETANRSRTQEEQDMEGGESTLPEATTQQRPGRSSRRTTSYYNSFQTSSSTSTDDPPSYDAAARHRPLRRPPGYGKEALPDYNCTVSTEGKVLLQLESISPLHCAGDSEWREVYMVHRGTLLNFHRVKDNGPGRLLIRYTLQHAEVGLAPDVQHTVLVPQSRLAGLIPSPARRRAWKKDPHLFRPVRQHVLRMRVETDQLIIADSSEEHINSIIHSISAGIDVAYAIDERSIPRQCTVPRRRRRQRTHRAHDLSDPSLLAEQERILRDMYPGFAERTSHSSPELERTVTNTTDDGTAEPLLSPVREEDELDLAVIREDFAAPSESAHAQSEDAATRPPATRQGTSLSVSPTYSSDMIHATSPANFAESGKWQPSHTRTHQQVQRYMRRCLPVLLPDAPRASDILVCRGTRVRVNWRMELMEAWELQPPSYKSHRFDFCAGGELERTRSCSQDSATQDPSHVFSAETDDQITPRAEDSESGGLAMSKLAPAVVDKGSSCDERAAATSPKPQQHTSSPPPGTEVHGVVFCF